MAARARRRADPRTARLTELAPAFALCAAYPLLLPATPDLAAALLRAKLGAAAPFALWSNWWYGGHSLPGYSALYPALAGAVGAPLLAAIAAFGAGAIAAQLVPSIVPGSARLTAAWIALAPAAELYSGRLPFTIALLPAAGAIAALLARRTAAAAAAAALTALISPVAALIPVIAGGAAITARNRDRDRRAAAAATIGAAVIPLGIAGALFGNPGSEPFAFATLAPILTLPALARLAKAPPPLTRAADLLTAACVLDYLIPNPLGSNLARIATLTAGPLLAARAPRRNLAAALALLGFAYLQWQAPIRDVASTAGDDSPEAAYYRPLIAALERLRAQTRSDQPFRVEVPPTAHHWEAYELAPRFPLARGWERQLDRGLNALFYAPQLEPASYERWLHRLAVAYIAVPDVELDYAARTESALIASGPPFLQLVARSGHWRVYAVNRPTPLADPPARVSALTATTLTVTVARAASVTIRVRWSPFWQLTGNGCIAARDGMLGLTTTGAETVELSQSLHPSRKIC